MVAKCETARSKASVGQASGGGGIADVSSRVWSLTAPNSTSGSSSSVSPCRRSQKCRELDSLDPYSKPIEGARQHSSAHDALLESICSTINYLARLQPILYPNKGACKA